MKSRHDEWWCICGRVTTIDNKEIVHLINTLILTQKLKLWFLQFYFLWLSRHWFLSTTPVLHDWNCWRGNLVIYKKLKKTIQWKWIYTNITRRNTPSTKNLYIIAIYWRSFRFRHFFYYLLRFSDTDMAKYQIPLNCRLHCRSQLNSTGRMNIHQVV